MGSKCAKVKMKIWKHSGESVCETIRHTNRQKGRKKDRFRYPKAQFESNYISDNARVDQQTSGKGKETVKSKYVRA